MLEYTLDEGNIMKKQLSVFQATHRIYREYNVSLDNFIVDILIRINRTKYNSLNNIIVSDVRFLKLLLKQVFDMEVLTQIQNPLNAQKLAFIKSVFTHRVHLMHAVRQC